MSNQEYDSLARVEKLIGEAKEAGAYLVLDKPQSGEGGPEPQSFGSGGQRRRIFRFASGYGVSVTNHRFYETCVLKNVSEDGTAGEIDLSTEFGGNQVWGTEERALRAVLSAAKKLGMSTADL